jgi:histone H3/H4
MLAVPLRDSLPRRPSVERQSISSDEDDNSEDFEDESMEIDPLKATQIDEGDAAEDMSSRDMSAGQTSRVARGHKQRNKVKKRIKISKYGIQYPSLPVGVVKRLATTFLRTGGNSHVKISKDTLDAIMQASDWFFEQVSDDLGIYAQHAGRKTIDESDVITLMKR